MSTSSSQVTTPVAIIGAGLSGLAAAVRLRELGIPCLVYEAQSQPGGRVRTVRNANGVNLDLGATWFHGTVGNAALDVAVESGAMQPPPPPLPEHIPKDETIIDEYGSLVFPTKGIHVLPSGEIRSLDSDVARPIISKYATKLRSMYNFDKASPDVPVLEVMEEATGYPQMTAFERAILRSRDLLECVVNGCSDSTRLLSAKRLSDYQVLPGDNIKPGAAGMSIVVAGLMGKLEYPQVVLDAEVTSISWGEAAESPSSPNVKIGFTGGKTVYAELVVWTPSLNVTKKAIADGVFDPELPASKIEALKEREQGVVEKVFAVLESPLKDVIANCAIPVVWELETCEGTVDMKSMGWQQSVYALTYNNVEQTICFWLSGDAGLRFNKLNKEEKICETSKMLTHLLKQEVAVEEVMNSCWALNEFVRGSYSYPRVGCSEYFAEILARPLPCEKAGVLFFAGEATHGRLYSTMHGAIESGYREAERCFRILEKRRSKDLRG